MFQHYGADNIYSLFPLRVIVHAAHAWKCTKDAQIRVGRSEDSEHKTLSVSLCWDSSTYRNWPYRSITYMCIMHSDAIYM